MPSLLVDRSRICWQTPVKQAEKCPVVIWHKVDLYGTGPRWHQAIRGIPAPGKDDTSIGNHFHILAPNGVLFVERNLKLPPWIGTEGGIDAFPLAHCQRIDSECKNRFRARSNMNRARHDHAG